MNEAQQQRLTALLSALCDNAATPAELAELEQMLTASPAARRYYAEYLVLHGDLSWEMPAHVERAAAGGDPPMAVLLADEPVAKPEPWLSRQLQTWAQRPEKTSLVIAATLMLAVLATLGLMGVPQPGDAVRPSRPDYVARLTRSVNCVWKDGGLAKADGADLYVGQELELLDGLAVVTFDSGAQVILQGRTSFRIDSSLAGHLERGKLTARVPQPAAGFLVSSALANVIDRGTEFGLEVAESRRAADGADTDGMQQDTGVHVFVGAVDVEWLDESGMITATERLAAGQAARRTARKAPVKALAAAAASFTRSVPELDELPITPAYVAAVRAARPLGYWRFEDLGAGVANEVSTNYRAEVDGSLELAAGQGNHTLRFDGRGGYLRVPQPLADFGRGDYSIEFWMLPTHFAYSTLISLHVPPEEANKPMFDHHGVVELVAESRESRDVRRIRFLHRSPAGVGGGANVFSAQRYELRQWQHVVALKRGEMLWLYLNGQPVASRSEPTQYTQSPVLGIGKLLHPGPRADRPFLGELDEVAVYTRALQEDEIRAHYRLVEDVRGR